MKLVTSVLQKSPDFNKQCREELAQEIAREKFKVKEDQDLTLEVNKSLYVPPLIIL